MFEGAPRDCFRGKLWGRPANFKKNGRWSEIEAPRTAELEIGTSGEARKRSRIEQRSSEIRVGWDIGQDSK